ncbi:unnamed protein product [Protopolystoma xenopodis]|uniref:Uncharacterized protein n=1 Tax=Protopolystoma xenopodis TaxID=117903 RepID=A0A448WNS0_9PLAT|nr:unnamed protein product [Protopolystoma xenopodis]
MAATIALGHPLRIKTLLCKVNKFIRGSVIADTTITALTGDDGLIFTTADVSEAITLGSTMLETTVGSVTSDISGQLYFAKRVNHETR